MQITWQQIHNYRKLVRRGLVTDILECSSCNEPYVTLLDSNDSCLLRCFMCGATKSMGSNLQEQIAQEVSLFDLHS